MGVIPSNCDKPPVSGLRNGFGVLEGDLYSELAGGGGGSRHNDDDTCMYDVDEAHCCDTSPSLRLMIRQHSKATSSEQGCNPHL